jgi:hypothetical protein
VSHVQDPSKADRRALRELAGTAYDRELSACLRELLSHFHDWEARRIDSFQLSDLIHKFHDGPSRELYKIFTGMKPAELVARAIVHGLLKREEVPSQLLMKLEQKINVFQELERDE